MSTRAPLLLTPGDPDGIGLELACKALQDRDDVVVITDPDRLRAEAAALSLRMPRVQAPPPSLEPLEVAAIRHAVAEIGAGRGRGLVTGPINKEKLVGQGFQYTGHTDFLGALTGVDRPVMAFVGGRLRVALVTVHVPLRKVADALSTEGVLHTILTAHEALQDQLSLVDPLLLVCGLNPHAGDGGVLGSEDAEVIAPAVRAAAAQGVRAEGPISAETAFRRAARGDGDLVVAMYHDQGLVPLKVVDFGRSVNWTLGLPFVRTSVDHGTAYDIAGQGIADPKSLIAALELADRLTRRDPG